MDKIGALWKKKDKDYLSGTIEYEGAKIPILVFKNNRKEKDNQPDYNICLKTGQQESKPRGEQQDDDIPF